MRLGLGEFFDLGTEKGDESRRMLVVGHDAVKNPVAIPAEEGMNIEDLQRYVDPTTAQRIARLLPVAAELGV